VTWCSSGRDHGTDPRLEVSTGGWSEADGVAHSDAQDCSQARLEATFRPSRRWRGVWRSADGKANQAGGGGALLLEQPSLPTAAMEFERRKRAFVTVTRPSASRPIASATGRGLWVCFSSGSGRTIGKGRDHARGGNGFGSAERTIASGSIWTLRQARWFLDRGGAKIAAATRLSAVGGRTAMSWNDG